MRTLLVGLTLLTVSAPGVAIAGPVTISEVLYDATGPDDGQVFVEIYGIPGTDLEGWSLRGVNGNGGGTTQEIDLTGLSIPADGFLVLADATSAGTTSVPNADALFTNLDLQNGPDSVELYSGSVEEDAVGYGDFSGGLVFGGEGAAAPDVPPGSSLARRYADVDTNDNSADFLALADPTPGTGPLSQANVVTTEPASILIFGAGLVMLALSFRRYSRKQISRPSSVAT